MVNRIHCDAMFAEYLGDHLEASRLWGKLMSLDPNRSKEWKAKKEKAIGRVKSEIIIGAMIANMDRGV